MLNNAAKFLSIAVGPVVETDTDIVILANLNPSVAGATEPSYWRAYAEGKFGVYHWLFDAPNEGVARFLASHVSTWQNLLVKNDWYGPDRIPKSRAPVMKILTDSDK